MSEAVPVLVSLGVIAVWVWIAVAVGKAASNKKRRRWLWTTLSFFPLGPIVGPLWLSSMPVLGEKATTGQIIGRSVLILLIVIGQAGRLAQISTDTNIKEKAESEFGYETESITVHYKQMDVDEIIVCVQLNSEISEMLEVATTEEGDDRYLFETQREADIFNSAVAMNAELECEDRTYDYTDLDEAMTRIERGEVSPIRNTLTHRTDAIDARVNRWNASAPVMVDDSTRLVSVSLENGEKVVSRLTLVDYVADEVSQAELIKFFEPELVAESCLDQDLADLRSKDYTLAYEYYGKDGESIGVIEIRGACESVSGP